MEDLITKIATDAIDNNLFPGCVIGIIYKNGKRIILPFGKYTYEDDANPIKIDSIFDVASITKVIPTSSLALKLIDEERLNIEDQLIKYIPEINNSNRENILIKHLLTHTLDYNLDLSSYKDRSAEDILKVIFNAELSSKPGTKFYYNNSTSILLGIVVERIFKDTLDNLGNKIFFDPLNMNNTTFYTEVYKKENIVPTEIDDWRGRLIQGEVHDESAYTLKSKIFTGSAGLFSTVPDLINFLEMLLNNGELNHQQFFSPKIIQQMYTNQLGHIGEFTGLGWELYQPRYMGNYCTKQTFGKTGFTGCLLLCDILKKTGLVILSNHIHPNRRNDSTMINQLRSDIADIVFNS